MSTQGRRGFLRSSLLATAAGAATVGGAGVVGSAQAAGAVAAPALVASVKPIVFKFQSSWATRDIFNEFAQDFAKKVNDMSGGQLRIDVYPANSLVKSFGIQNAVHKGQLDGGHGVPTYWHDRNAAFSLFGSGPSFGMNANQFLAWMNYGGGQALYDELVQKTMNLNIQGFLYGPLAPQPLGWFKQRIDKVKDLQGLRFRAVGLAAEVFKEMGLQTTALPAHDIVAWLDKGLIDAAEFNNPSSDRALGFPSVSNVCMIRSFHQACEVFEVIFNRDRFNSLSFELRSMIKYALQAASADMSWKAADRFSTDYEEMRRKQGVRFFSTPEEILKAQLAAWKKIILRESVNSPIFKKIIESQQRFAKKAVGFELDFSPPVRMDYTYWFGAS
ncbi:MAG: TRAP transporter substrate-binding protein [Limnobacter sp.]|nr:TRAP transporter substrate-binding protein [Limnobacter sp.]